MQSDLVATLMGAVVDWENGGEKREDSQVEEEGGRCGRVQQWGLRRAKFLLIIGEKIIP